ncbi:MAG TPA: hypothetical protein V6C52_03090 [Coleofasciculaceae cyanobacterium]|jgi:hypothetical protein
MTLHFGGTTTIITNAPTVRMQAWHVFNRYSQNLGEPVVDVFDRATETNPYSFALVTSDAEFERWFRDTIHAETVVKGNRHGFRTKIERDDGCQQFPPDSVRLPLRNVMAWYSGTLPG